jgi:phosphoenolpyruvate carboxykinase (ATP)
MLNAALSGTLNQSEFVKDPVFGFGVPQTCDGVPSEILNPASSWPSRKEYDQKYHQLAARFIDNFKKFAPDCPPEVVEAGPVI